MIRSLATCALALTTSAALAECPTSFADAAHGVYIEFDAVVVRYDRRADGLVEEVEFDTETGEFFRYIGQHGVFGLSSWEMSDGGMLADSENTYRYDAALPATITPNMQFSAMTNVQYGSDAPFQEAVSMTTGDLQTQTIAGCTLSTIAVELRNGPPNDEYINTYTYFPQLGFGSYVGGGPSGEALDSYRITYIGTEPRRVGAAASTPDRPSK